MFELVSRLSADEIKVASVVDQESACDAKSWISGPVLPCNPVRGPSGFAASGTLVTLPQLAPPQVVFDDNTVFARFCFTVVFCICIPSRPPKTDDIVGKPISLKLGVFGKAGRFKLDTKRLTLRSARTLVDPDVGHLEAERLWFEIFESSKMRGPATHGDGSGRRNSSERLLGGVVLPLPSSSRDAV